MSLFPLTPPPTLDGAPSCAVTCVASALVGTSGCVTAGAYDISCQCGAESAIIWNSALPCLDATCSGTDILTAKLIWSFNPVCSSYSAANEFPFPTTTPNALSSPSSEVTIAGKTSFTTTASLSSTNWQSNSTTITPAVSKVTTRGLKAGAKTGIGVGVTLGILVWTALIAFVLWHRRRVRCTKPELEQRPNTHEMATNSNRHELPTQSNVHQMEHEKQGVLTTLEENDLKPHQSQIHELDANSRILRPGLQSNAPPSPYELDLNPKPTIAVPSSSISVSRGQGSNSRKPGAPTNIDGKTEEKESMQNLDIRERIRIKKERLWELREENTRRAILVKAAGRTGEELTERGDG